VHLQKKTLNTKGKGQEEDKIDQEQGIVKPNLLKPNHEEVNKVKMLLEEAEEEVVEEAAVEDVDVVVKEVLEKKEIISDLLHIIKEKIRDLL
jgi:hypothetical protein